MPISGLGGLKGLKTDFSQIYPLYGKKGKANFSAV